MFAYVLRRASYVFGVGLTIITGMVSVGDAQEPVDWSTPVDLADTSVYSGEPAVVADQYGFVHVFWVEDVGGEPAIRSDASTASGNTILYRRWDGTHWTEPIDLFFVEEGDLRYPVAAMDTQGLVHLVWRAAGGLYYSHAEVSRAGNAHAWRPQQLLALALGGFQPAFVADTKGTLHLAYTRLINVEERSRDGNVYYMRSSNSGRTWSSPILVSDIEARTETQADTPGLAVDGRDRVHLTWYTGDPPDWLGTSVFYAKSVNAGKTWSLPHLVDKVEGDENWASKPVIAARGLEEIHLIWVCGQLAFRCHQWSSDGGETWSRAQRVFGDLHGLSFWDAVALDGSDTLYWVSVVRYPQALYYSYWDGSDWVDPPMVASDDFRALDFHGLEPAVRQGNELHVLAVWPFGPAIWHIWGKTRASPSPTLPTPAASSPTPSLSATPRPLATSASTPDGQDGANVQPSLPGTSQNPQSAILWGVLPALILTMTVIILRTRRRAP